MQPAFASPRGLRQRSRARASSTSCSSRGVRDGHLRRMPARLVERRAASRRDRVHRRRRRARRPWARIPARCGPADCRDRRSRGRSMQHRVLVHVAERPVVVAARGEVLHGAGGVDGVRAGALAGGVQHADVEPARHGRADRRGRMFSVDGAVGEAAAVDGDLPLLQAPRLRPCGSENSQTLAGRLIALVISLSASWLPLISRRGCRRGPAGRPRG